MADDVRARIRRGDLAALLDPALPLHLLAEPGAEWWRIGHQMCCRTLELRLTMVIQARHAAEVAQIKEEHRRLHGGDPGTLCLADLRRLRVLWPSHSFEVDAALAILARYAEAP